MLTYIRTASMLMLLMVLPAIGAFATEEEAKARAVIDELFRAFNDRDSDGYYATFHYPQVSIGQSGSLSVSEAPPERPMNFDALTSREGWHHSVIDFTKLLGSASDKVHFDVQFKRYKEDGTAYGVWRGIWIMTKKDGKWGVQARSFLPVQQLGTVD